ncbi:hypothetical protein KJZ99_00070 [bacterium]|nr:hypothetical protein [bacterium]
MGKNAGNSGLRMGHRERRAAAQVPLRTVELPPRFLNADNGGLKVDIVEQAMEFAREEFQLAHKRPMSHWEEYQAYSRIQFEVENGFDPTTPEVVNAETGERVRLDSVMLSDIRTSGPRDPLYRGRDVSLSTPLGVNQGNTAGDRAVVTAPVDDGLLGRASAVMPIALLAEILRLRGRKRSHTWLSQPGPAPDLTFRLPLVTSSAESKGFDADARGKLSTLKSGIVPRAEGGIGYEVGVDVDFFDFMSCGYMFHCPTSWELMASRGGRMLRLENMGNEHMMELMDLVDDHDTILGLFTALTKGYVRYRQSAAWDVATREVARGKARYITTNALKYWWWFDQTGGQFYTPHAGANYLKYANASAVTSGFFGTSPVPHPIFKVLYALAALLDDRNQPLEAASFPRDLLMQLGADEKHQNKLYETGDDVRFTGDPGYVGTIRLPGSGERVAIIKQAAGSVPLASIGTADTSALYPQGLVIGGSVGRAMVHKTVWAPTLTVEKEYKLNASDVTRPTGRNVATLYNLRCIEPFDLESVAMIQVMDGAPGA